MFRDVNVWEAMAWLLPGAAVLLSLMPVGDLAYLVRAGQLMRASGGILRVDVFTFTMGGQPWLNQQWGAEIGLAGLYGLFGWRGLALVRAALVSLSVGVTYRRVRARGTDELVAGTLTLGAFLVALTLPGTFALRPQLLVVPLFLLSSSIVSGRVAHPARLSVLPLVGVVWANVHGSFLLLPLLLLIAFCHDLIARSRTCTWTGFLVLATLVTPLATPWGTDTYRYLTDVTTSPVIRDVIDEWKPLTHQWPAGALFLAGNALMLWVLWRHRSRKPTIEEALTYLAFTSLAIWSGRNLLWWMLAVPPVVGGLLEGWHPGGSPSSRKIPAVTIALCILLVIGVVHVVEASPPETLLSEAPAGITAAVQEDITPGARIFDGRWGSWFEFAVPDLSMFVDSRAELFSEATWSDYFRISGAEPGWQHALSRWGITAVVAARDHDAPLITALSTEAGWDLRYEDSDGAVFVRSDEA